MPLPGKKELFFLFPQNEIYNVSRIHEIIVTNVPKYTRVPRLPAATTK
jgi:hypothetical protein